MTNQEAFDRVVMHLLAQGRKSESRNGASLYRGPGGLKCAIGALIPDDAYDPMMEGCMISHYLVGEAAAPSRRERMQELFSGVSVELLADLSDVHDFNSVEFWPNALASVAEKYKLAASPELSAK